MRDFAELLNLPGTPQERARLMERLETLSEWEKTVLAAITLCRPPAVMADAANCLNAMEDSAVLPITGGYEGLGKHYLRFLAKDFADELLEHVDLYSLGKQFEEAHPGLFIGNDYVIYPPKDQMPDYGEPFPSALDSKWSVKLKLASPAAPEGVWLRLPDYSEQDSNGAIGEVAAAMAALKVHNLDECTMLDARCILPEAGNLLEQYNNIPEMIRDGNNLGCVLDEQGQGAPDFMARFAAALEYESCHDLHFALDISQNLHCYEWVDCEKLSEFAAKHLNSSGVPLEPILFGCINLDSYAKDLLESSGYMLTGDEKGYVLRNARNFTREFSTPPQQGQDSMTMQ